MPAELILHSPPMYSPLLYGPLVVTGPTITSRSIPPRIRPCLSSGSLPLDSLRNNDGKQKKRVVFADDFGRPLTQVFLPFLRCPLYLCLCQDKLSRQKHSTKEIGLLIRIRQINFILSRALRHSQSGASLLRQV